MAKNIIWQGSHYLCILAQLGMIVVGILLFIVNTTNGGVLYNVIYPWAAGVIGSFGLGAGIIIFVLLTYLRRPRRGTRESYYMKHRIAIGASLIAQTFFTLAEIAIGAVIATKAPEKGDLAAVAVLAIIAGVVSLVTGALDVFQLMKYRQTFHGHGDNTIGRISESPDGSREA